MHRLPYKWRCSLARCLRVEKQRFASHQLSGFRHDQKRNFGLDAVATILTPPAVFCGLLISLWTYKCMMMVLFQNKIIYMPSVPPFSRSEEVENYAVQCRPIQWSEIAIKSTDGTKIRLLEGKSTRTSVPASAKQIVVLYLQGNASSLPPRLPFLSRVLQSVNTSQPDCTNNANLKLIALSYRGFWKSSGSPSQPGIEKDVSAALQWIFERYPVRDTTILLWGQSIGAGAAAVALANLLQRPEGTSQLRRVSGLVLETPFTDLKTMLVSLYPQKFLPYRYLAPFLRSTWDSKSALATVMDTKPELRILLLQAGDDELVPPDNALILEEVCKSRGAVVERMVIAGALHTEAMAKPQGRQAISKFIASFVGKR